jgi:hypothetical protein
MNGKAGFRHSSLSMMRRRPNRSLNSHNVSTGRALRRHNLPSSFSLGQAQGKAIGMEILFVEIVQIVVLLIVGLGLVLTLKY